VKAIQKLFGQIDAQKKSIDRLEADRSAARAAIEGASDHVASLSNLRGQRRRLLAEAMIAKKVANTTAVDAQILNAEQLHGAAQTAAATAHDALDIIEEGIRIAETELGELQGQLRDAIGAEIIAQHDAALEKYVAAVAMLEDGVVGMVAAERAWKNARGALDYRPFPRHGEKVLGEIRETGLRVPYTASRLADPKVAAEYTPDYLDYWFLPAWADPLTADFADQRTTEIIDALAKAGVDCGALKRAPVPEKTVKVRIKKGRIVAAPKITRSAATGEVVSEEKVEFGPDEDVWIEESIARRMKASRLVLIHGEDEIPTAQAETTGPMVIDASPPKESQDRILNMQARSEYRGTFHSLDMSGYE
jgi:hypothetical protein